MTLLPRIALAALGLLSLSTATAAPAGEAPGLVTTSGEGRVEVAPDIAWLSFGVSARRPTVEAARDAVAEVVAAVIALARETGLGDKDIATAAVSVRPEFDWDPQTRERRMLGYMVSRDIQLRLEDLSRLGEVTEAALGAGVTDAAPARFDTSRRAEIENEALTAAARDARARAEVLAAALGASVGSPVRISAAGALPPPMPAARGEMLMAADAQSAAQTYETGRIVVTARVTAEFRLLANQGD